MEKLLLTAISVLLLTACDKEPTHDVKYYMEHKEELKEKIAECRNNPGEKDLTANCINACSAMKEIMVTNKEMPKIRLSR